MKLIGTNATYPNFYQKPSDVGQDAKLSDKKKVNIGVALTSVGATLLPLLILRKKQGKVLDKDVFQKLGAKDKTKAFFNSFNIEYNLKEMLMVGGSSILGGLFGGFIFDKKGNKKEKTQEAVSKMFNILIPTTIVSGLTKLTEVKNIKSPIAKVGAIVIGVGLGMPISNFISNKINSKIVDKDNFEEKKLKPKDYLVHIDDIAGALILSKVPFIDKLHLDKLLAGIYVFNGFEVGKAKD